MLKLLKSTSVNGIIQMLISLFSVWHHVDLFYQYRNSSVLFFFIIPDWALILIILTGLTGFWIGLSVYLENRKVKTGYLLLLGLFVLGFAIKTIAVM